METEANSSAAAGLALFSWCNLLKISLGKIPLFAAPPVVCQDSWPYIPAYIRPRKPFIISDTFNIPNRKPFVMSKSPCTPKEACSSPLDRSQATSHFVYTCMEVLCYQYQFVYTQPQPLCYQQNDGIYLGKRVHGSESLETHRQTRPGPVGPKTCRNPLKAASGRLAVTSVPSRRIYLWHS